MKQAIINELSSVLTKIRFGGGYTSAPVATDDQKKLSQVQVEVGRWVAPGPDEVSQITCFAKGDICHLHLRFHLTCAPATQVPANVLASAMLFGTGLEGCAITIDDKGRFCLVYNKSFTSANAGEIRDYIENAIKYYRQKAPLLRTEFSKMGLKTQLPPQPDLQILAGMPIKLTPQELEALSGGGFWSALGIGVVFWVVSGMGGVATLGAADVMEIVATAAAGAVY